MFTYVCNVYICVYSYTQIYILCYINILAPNMQTAAVMHHYGCCILLMSMSAFKDRNATRLRLNQPYAGPMKSGYECDRHMMNK